MSGERYCPRCKTTKTMKAEPFCAKCGGWLLVRHFEYLSPQPKKNQRRVGYV